MALKCFTSIFNKNNNDNNNYNDNENNVLHPNFRWTKNEEKELIDKIENNFTIDEVSLHNNRSINSIQNRIKKIAYDLYIEGNSVKNIVIKTKLTEKQVNKIIINKNKQYENKRKEYREKNSEDIDFKNEISNINNKLDQLFNLLENQED
tara:strand:- start:148 stop:597 length:450 start_codon:yes stop_codon:yes gene_type:complete